MLAIFMSYDIIAVLQVIKLVINQNDYENNKTK